MMNIAQPLNDFIVFGGKKIKLNLAFDNVLRVYDLFKEVSLLDCEKAQFALSMLVRGKLTDIGALDAIFKEYIEMPRRPCSGSSIKTVDFRQDSPYIYSSFYADYGIDLLDQQGKLHWQKFIALFQGLSEHTKIREIMSIRARPYPKPNKHNAEQIQALRELKAYYALDISQDERQRNFQEGLRHLAETLTARARE